MRSFPQFTLALFYLFYLIFLRAVRFIFSIQVRLVGGGDGGMAGWEVHSSSDTDSHR